MAGIITDPNHDVEPPARNEGIECDACQCHFGCGEFARHEKVIARNGIYPPSQSQRTETFGFLVESLEFTQRNVDFPNLGGSLVDIIPPDAIMGGKNLSLALTTDVLATVVRRVRKVGFCPGLLLLSFHRPNTDLGAAASVAAAWMR